MRRVEFIKNNSIFRSLDIFESPSGSGYHLYIKTSRDLNFSQKILYRKLFKDDGQRIVFDLLKRERLKDVLFSQRINKGIITKEVFILRVV